MHILIVEDDEVARDYLAKALREVGHAVDVASNGLEGLQMASSMAIDLAIVDRMLPKLDGWRWCSRCGPPAARCRS